MCEALKTSFRNEHTLVGLIAPPEEEEALTTSQFIQLFFTALMVDMGFACFNADTSSACGGELQNPCTSGGGGGRRGGGGGGGGDGTDSSSGGGLFDFQSVSPVSAVITGSFAAIGIAIITGMCSYVFRWGKYASGTRTPSVWFAPTSCALDKLCTRLALESHRAHALHCSSCLSA